MCSSVQGTELVLCPEQSPHPPLTHLNPFRYRGYVFDDETGLYYLQSRYYDPITGRFLNADDTAFIGATGTVLSGNLFAYCENNPNYYIDKFGNFAMAAVATVTVTNWWNPIGWIGAILWTVAIVCVIYTCIDLGMKNGKALPQLSKQKKTKIPEKLKKNGKVKTPETHKGEFTDKGKGVYEHKKLNGSAEELRMVISTENLTGTILQKMQKQVIIIM